MQYSGPLSRQASINQAQQIIEHLQFDGKNGTLPWETYVHKFKAAWNDICEIGTKYTQDGRPLQVMSNCMIVNKFLDNIEDPRLAVLIEVTRNFAYLLTLDQVVDHMQRNMDTQRHVSNRYIHAINRSTAPTASWGRQGGRGAGRGG
jgi:hypothetical protein